MFSARLSDLSASGTASSQVRDEFSEPPACAVSSRERRRLRYSIARQTQQRLHALTIFSVHEHQSAVVSFGNLTAQRETNSRAFGLRGKKRNEKISGVHDAGTFVFNKDLNAISFLPPAKCDVSMCFERGVNSI